MEVKYRWKSCHNDKSLGARVDPTLFSFILKSELLWEFLNQNISSSLLEETEEAYTQHVKMMQKESEDLKSSKKRAEEALKAEKMWSKEKKLEVERLEAEVKGLEQIKDEFGTKVEENKMLCENAFFR